MKRHNLVIPDDLHATLTKVAKKEGMSVAALIRRWIKLGLLWSQGDVTITHTRADGTVVEVELL